MSPVYFTFYEYFNVFTSLDWKIYEKNKKNYERKLKNEAGNILREICYWRKPLYKCAWLKSLEQGFTVAANEQQMNTFLVQLFYGLSVLLKKF